MKKSGRENLWIVIPAYNEEKNIETVIRQWHAIVDKTGEDSRLLLVDDGSKDHTLNIARHLQKTCPRLVAVTKENGGHGAAVLFGYHYAVSHGADIFSRRIPTGRRCRRNSGRCGKTGNLPGCCLDPDGAARTGWIGL